MITNFKLSQKLCKKHGLPEGFICLGKNCSTHALLCSSCVKKDHPHLATVHSIPNFITYFSHFLTQARERMDADRCEISIAGVVKAKKQEIQQLHLQLLERIMKKLSDEKKAICQSLDQLEREYRDKERVLMKNQRHRMEIIDYLLPYAQSNELLELKLKTSSGWGLTRLKEYLSELERLTNSFDKSCLIALENSVASEACQRIDATLFKSLPRFIKEQSVLTKPPLPDRVYSFNQRKGGVRPSSSGERKCGSAQSGSTKTNSLRQF